MTAPRGRLSALKPNDMNPTGTPPRPNAFQRLVARFSGTTILPAQWQSDRMPDLERWVMPHRAVDMQDWEVAKNMATNIYRPDRSRLMDLYDSLLIDSHLASVMESRVLRVVRSKYKLVDAKGEAKPELNALLEQQWFEDCLQYMVEANFTGHTLIELGELVKPGQLKNVTRIDPRNVLPWHGVVAKRQGDETGYKFREAPLKDYLIEVGRADDLGILERVAPVVIIKKYAMGSWSDFVSKYGIPPRWVKTNSRDARRVKQLEAMMQQMVSSAYAVIMGDEEFQVMPTPQGDPHKVFDDLIKRMNSEISKRVLGQDGTSDNKDASGTYGSLQVLQGVAEDRHQADKAGVMYLINNELLPRLVNLGYPLAGVRFVWDEFSELSAMETVDAVAKLGLVFDIDPTYVEEKTGIRILGARRMPGEVAPGEPAPDGKKEDAPPVDGTIATDIQDSAMNGAQVQSLLELITKVASGEIPESVARPIIRTAFPKVPEQRINEMLSGLEEFRRELLKHGTPPDSGKQKGGKPAPPKKEEEASDEDDDEDGANMTAQWPTATLPNCGICGGRKGTRAEAAPELAAETLEQLLRDTHAGAAWSQPYFEAVRDVYSEGLLGQWRGQLEQLAYDAPDHAARAAMEVNLARFGTNKTLAVITELNEHVRDSKGYADFRRRVEESGILKEYNGNYLATEYTNAINTGMQASRWYDLQRSADALPWLEYWTAGDAQVRPAHAELDGKRWPADDPIWARIAPPNGHGCRCTLVGSDEGPTGTELVEQSKRSLGALDASGELERMAKTGFDKNRAVTAEVFALNKSYAEQLGVKAGMGADFGLAESYGREATAKSWEQLSKGALPGIDSMTGTSEQTTQFFNTMKNADGVAVLRDHAGRPVVLRESLMKATSERLEGSSMLDQLSDVLHKPDEIWLSPIGELHYMRFTDRGLLRVPVHVDAKHGMHILDWELHDTNVDAVRKGLLVKRHR